jgi:hypothetical protein
MRHSLSCRIDGDTTVGKVSLASYLAVVARVIISPATRVMQNMCVVITRELPSHIVPFTNRGNVNFNLGRVTTSFTTVAKLLIGKHRRSRYLRSTTAFSATMVQVVKVGVVRRAVEST